MSHSHSHDAPLSPQGAVRHRRALRLMVVVLIPLAIWTIAGLIALWPSDTSDHIRKDISQYTVTGVTYPTAEITAVTETSCDGMVGSTPGGQEVCANVRAKLTEGPENGQEVEVVLNSAIFQSGAEVGDKLKLVRIPIEGQPAVYQFADFERTVPLGVITALFAIAVVAVARWRGLRALVGLGFAGFILIKFMFPALINGSNPIAVGLVGSAAIMFVVLYASHGFSARTTTALVGTLFGLVLITALGWVGTKWAHLTGVSAEDDLILAATTPDMRLTSVVICGIIVAGLGVLNDVTITQASAVWELADSDPDHSRLFSRAMRIGRDHIASTVYTIAFATAGAVLPVLLLIAVYDRPMFEVLQTEMFATELIRTMVGSIGLVLAVPLTTAIGVAVVRASNRRLPAEAGAATADPGDVTNLAEDVTTQLPAVKPVEVEPTPAPATPTTPAAPAEAGRLRGRLRERLKRHEEFDEEVDGFANLHEDADEPTPRRGRSEDQ